MVNRRIQALSWNGQRGDNVLWHVGEVLELLKGEQMLKVGRGEKFLEFFVSFASLG